MNIVSNPETVAAPRGDFSHVVEVPPDARWLAVAGQLGIDPRGRLLTGVRAQSEQALRNVLACLRAHGMRRQDLVRTVIYLTDPRGIDDFRAARRRVLGSARPASTLLVVDGLASPDYLVEVEAWAARA